MLCAVAIIGAGYAAFTGTFTGTAKTYNEDNKVDVGYMTLVGGTTASTDEWSSISTEDIVLQFHEYTYHEEVNNTDTNFKAYYLTDAAYATADLIVIGEGQSAVSYANKVVGEKTFILSSAVDKTIANITVELYADKGVGNSDFVYILSVGCGDNVQYKLLDATAADEYSFDFTGLSITSSSPQNIDVKLYIGYTTDGSIAKTHPIGAPTGVVTDNSRYNVHSVEMTNGANAPEGFSALSFAISVSETAPAAPASP